MQMERQYYVTDAFCHQPYLPIGQNLCHVPGRLTALNDGTQATALPPGASSTPPVTARDKKQRVLQRLFVNRSKVS